jgi:diguanylate cyclase (GGDEF)-like protein
VDNFPWLTGRSRFFWVITTLVMVVLLGGLDYLTGYELSFSLFYLAPISLAAWFVGRRFSLLISVASALSWLVADVATGHVYSSPMYFLWNTAIRLGFFIIVSVLLAELRTAFRVEQELARVDNLTGALNSRYFYQLTSMEVDRSNRYKHPLTLAYFDLDNFKGVNDRFGHNAGDQLLQALVRFLRAHIRRTDIIGRMGGDEFVLLLPETGEVESRAIFSRLLPEMNRAIQNDHWPVTFSVGVVTFYNPPAAIDELLRQADNLMYAVKAGGKNNVRYLTLGEPVHD